MSLIFYYLEDGTLPNDPLEAKKIVQQFFSYSILNAQFYRWCFLRPWLTCLTLEEGMKSLIDIHEGLCDSHKGAQTITKKAFRQRYFWL